MKKIQPRQPSNLSPYSHACLDALVKANLAERISIGGALGLFHSFQIAARTTHLEEPVSAGWIEIPLDSLADLVASKMTALVERGAPRDFLDIYTICQSGMVNINECWSLWHRRETLAGSDADFTRARLAIETHLERISLHRPLDKITNAQQHDQARLVREWFTSKFLQVNNE